MTRATQFAALTFVATALYTLAYLRILPLPHADALLSVVPWWALVAFGSYALGSLGWGLASFRECPEAHAELAKEIQMAKDDLRSQGVSVD